MKFYIKTHHHFTNALVLLATLFFTACSKDETEEIPQPETPINIVLNETELNLNVGDTFQLTATGNTTNETIQWSSSDTSIATVEDGVVTTLKGGDAIITAQVGTAQTACTIIVAPDVYMLGVLYSDGTGKREDLYKYWKNDVEYILEEPGKDIFVEGDDIYIAGNIEINGFSVAGYWKNGQRLNLTDGSTSSTANAIFVVNGDVYVVGFMDVGTKQLATLWKNGEASHLFNQNSEANAIVVQGNDVYVAGSFNEQRFGRISLFWKNNELIPLTTGVRESNAYDIFVSNGDVYVVGFEDNGTNFAAKYWKNGQTIPLGDGSESSNAFSIAVSNNEVHVVGGMGPNAGPMATYWKNGEKVPLQNSNNSYASDIAIVNETVHIVGSSNVGDTTGSPIARYWVDGQLNEFQPKASVIHALFIR